MCIIPKIVLKNNFFFIIIFFLYRDRGLSYMVFNATFNNISATLWRSVLLVEETRVPGENHWLPQVTLSHNVVSSAPGHERDLNSQLSGDRHWLHK